MKQIKVETLASQQLGRRKQFDMDFSFQKKKKGKKEKEKEEGMNMCEKGQLTDLEIEIRLD